MRQTLKYCFWMIFVLLLAACSPSPTTITATPTPEIDVNAFSTQVAATFVAEITPTAAPTATIFPTSTQTSNVTLTPLPFVTLDGLRAAYIIKGNLYVQDSGKQPVQLTNKGQDTDPIFSDDGEKIVFYRGGKLSKRTYQVYRINADGSGEEAFVTSTILTALNIGYDQTTELRSLAFVHGTHKLLFNTEQFPSTALRGGDSKPQPNLDLLIADTDTGNIKQLRVPGQAGGFSASPNGNLIWVGAADHIDLIGLDGKIVHKNFVINPLISPGTPDLWNPRLAWMEGGDKLFVIPLDASLGAQGNDGVPEPRTIWLYPTNGGKAQEIHISPPLMGNMFNISPDGNWVVYTFGDFAQETQETATLGIYLGNLRDGTTKLIGTGESYDLPLSPNSYDWSPDSTHFIFEDYQDQMFMGNIRGEIFSLGNARFARWIDANRYLYEMVTMAEIGKEEKGRVIDLLPSIPYMNYQYFTLVFRK